MTLVRVKVTGRESSQCIRSGAVEVAVALALSPLTALHVRPALTWRPLRGGELTQGGVLGSSQAAVQARLG